MDQPVIKRHFTFEMYAPTSVSPSGVPIVDRVSVQMQGDNLSLGDVMDKFQQFLIACGYEP